ncbi:site-specific integrase [Psychrobacter sp. SCQQ22]|uniref:site-specific integrase n=1 Tax=Psychrobacter sp. SCQQ22 TaxID=2792059 RepID=UPI0018CCF09D|nr:site-specific integrase [Psychrobacter sp. SCQQ22]MBH0086601.1 site-specific integrase [Psychrobacter sp. SCQQ22]
MRPSLKDLFDSNAKVIYLSRFKLKKVNWSKTTYSFSSLSRSDYFFKMPVIIQSDGLPWKIANLYLIGQLDTPNLSNMKTLSARAIHLKYYLRYLEHSNQHFLDLPTQYQQRVPHKFRSFLQSVIEQHDFSAEYINTILSSVVHFYNYIQNQALIPSSDIENKPFTERSISIAINNNVGLSKRISVMTNDLKLKSSRQPIPSLGRLRDGGSLRPLSPEEQEIIFKAFDNDYASIELELMIRIALETGARQQSVCTLSVACIKTALDYLERHSESEHAVIKTGYRHKTDSKGGRLNRLIFTRSLIYRLATYIDCERAENRRNKINSFYSGTEDNYVFLTNTGNPYLTAERELIDRNNPQSIWNTKAPVMVPKNGQSLRNEIKRFIDKAQKFEPNLQDFSFHDLRATYGMNIVRNLRTKGYPDSKIFDHVRQRLNHRSLTTTEAYLKFDSEINEFNDIQDTFGVTFDKGKYYV